MTEDKSKKTRRKHEELLVIQRCLRQLESLDLAAQVRAAEYVLGAVRGEQVMVPTQQPNGQVGLFDG